MRKLKFSKNCIAFGTKLRKQPSAYNHNYHKKERTLEEIPLNAEERQSKFSFWNLQSGLTWKWLQYEYFENTKKNNFRKRVNDRLFQNISSVRQILISKPDGLTENEANSLILRLIFIRYLIV